jgi:hypothetical protein
MVEKLQIRKKKLEHNTRWGNQIKIQGYNDKKGRATNTSNMSKSEGKQAQS